MSQFLTGFLTPFYPETNGAYMTVKVFVSYSHKDAEFRRKLQVHLASLRREGAIETFFDGDIHPGENLDAAIRRELRDARIFVALASPEYISSTYCFEKEYQYAIRRAKRKTMNVVVAVVRPCGWKHTRMANYKALPEDGKEVTTWGNRDSAFEDIVNGVRRVVKLVEGEGGKTAASKTPQRTATKPVVRKSKSPARDQSRPEPTPKPSGRAATAKKVGVAAKKNTSATVRKAVAHKTRTR